MLRELTPFKFESNQLRLVTVDGEPWFVIADICTILERTNPSQAVKGLDSEDVQAIDSSALIFSEGGQIKGIGNTQVNITNESGLYTLLLRSNKAQAKPFRRWVTSEVLPSIRKTGKYAGPPVPPPLEFQRRLEKLEADVIPKALAFDRLDTIPGTLCIADAAKVLGIPQSVLFEELKERHWIFKRSEHGKWLPYADKEKRGYLILCIDTAYDEEAEKKEYPQTRVTTKGLARLAYLLVPKPPKPKKSGIKA